ncbi:hypothetical protein H8D30_02565 [bacterium]|nr:hypothetical protein [bacterium]
MTVLRVPSLGKIEGDIVLSQWLVDEGAAVQEGDEVVELETSKVVFSVESPFAGFLSHEKTEGSTVLIGERLGSFT